MKYNLLPGKILFLFLIVATFSFTSCKKDKKQENETTKKERISDIWKVADVKNADGVSMIGLPIPQIVCLKDNIFTLKTDDTYSIDEGGEVCDPSTAGSGTWSFIDNDSKLKFTPTTGDPLIFDFLEVTDSNLRIAYTVSGSGIPSADGLYTIILVKA